MAKIKNKFILLCIPIIICFLISCTVKTTYLSFKDHLKNEVSTTYNWEIAQDKSFNNIAIDTIVNNLEHLQSLLIIKNDKIVYEKYKGNLSNKMPHNIKSVSKSITSLLVGIAIQQGYISLNTNLEDLFGNEIDIDASSAKVTIQQLLTMNGGFPQIGSRFYWIVCASFNPVKSTIKIRRNIKPGETSEYSDIGANLLGYAVAKASNLKLSEFAGRYLFSPIGITSVEWSTDLQGNNISAADIFLCPRDLARIGYLMLHKGNIKGQQIISEKWVEESITKSTVIPDFPENLSYGYLWWLDDNNIRNAFCAIGWGGQILYISPDDNMIFVASATLKNRGWPSIIKSIRNIIELNRK